MGGLAQAASKAMAIISGSLNVSRIERKETVFAIEGNLMTLLLLEALGALLLLLFIVWWTMFSGRKNGELREEDKPPAVEPGARDK